MAADALESPGQARLLLRTIGWIGALMLLVGLFWIRLDVVIEDEGVVEARDGWRIYAPRTARVEEILVEAGQRVAEGAPLLRLRDETLERDILDVRERLEALRLEARLAETRLREVHITGGSVEARAAEASLKLRRENEALLKEIASMYERLQQEGSVSTMERIRLTTQQLAARREALRDETLLSLRDEGYVELLLQRETLLRDGALARAAILEERLRLLQEQSESLLLRAARAGLVTNVFAREPGQRVEAGALVLGMADPAGGYELRMFVADRNVDLLRPGLPVRIESAVYASSSEGYMEGRVLSRIADKDSPQAGGFEVRVEVTRWPVEPVIGSRVRAEILLQRQGLLQLVRRNPLRQPSPTPEGSDGPG